MRILLLGEYSNVHATLAEGLRRLGHEVTVASNGDFWKNYPRDIDLSRTPGKIGGIRLISKILRNLSHFRGYDIVQLVNPMFMELKAERLMFIYNYLRRHNRCVVLGGFGMDWYVVHTCVENKPLRYSDFNIGETLRTNADALRERESWLGTAKERLNRHIAQTCDGIVTGLYEYWVCYSPYFPEKTTFIPYPIVMPDTPVLATTEKLRLFIGINTTRSEYKGTDVMLSAAREVEARHPGKMDIRVVQSVPFAEYERLMNGSDAIMDQLYSYTPSMNPLLAMSKGIICIGGGEPENYEILGEETLRPIINVGPTRDSVIEGLEWLLAHPEEWPRLKQESVEYVRRHHDFLKVARQYELFYERLIARL